ncbi:hypothetical protein AAFF_G00406480 [Aldrovandia affinis]|uniref:Uncharacterized protein n=1 Tax=Aldrovandia affinis TaxID=143900 RepID=A0AAD7SCP8_9TELE|nr:hypothetical protein AAFF_G00406480 [Aldrovandia affinis]
MSKIFDNEHSKKSAPPSPPLISGKTLELFKDIPQTKSKTTIPITVCTENQENLYNYKYISHRNGMIQNSTLSP